MPAGRDAAIPVFPADAKNTDTRKAGGDVLSAIAPKLPPLTGGSADFDPSTFTAVAGLDVFSTNRELGEHGVPAKYGVESPTAEPLAYFGGPIKGANKSVSSLKAAG